MRTWFKISFFSSRNSIFRKQTVKKSQPPQQQQQCRNTWMKWELGSKSAFFSSQNSIFRKQTVKKSQPPQQQQCRNIWTKWELGSKSAHETQYLENKLLKNLSHRSSSSAGILGCNENLVQNQLFLAHKTQYLENKLLKNLSHRSSSSAGKREHELKSPWKLDSLKHY
jgi:hypothetical protein